MKISDFALTRLRNEEHFQFQTSFRDLVLSITMLVLKIEKLFGIYLPLYQGESESLDIIHKSAISDDLTNADLVRDETFRGLCDAVKSALNHFRAEVRHAAERLHIVLDNYGNLAIKAYDSETGGLTSLMGDFTGKYAADVATVGITEWVTELKANNTAFDDLKNNRYSEAAAKTIKRMKEERAKVDAAYHAVVERINALIIVEGDATYATFVNELNKRIDGYDNTLSIRKGKAQKTVEAKA